MLTSSAKAKGRRACQKLREELLKAFPELQPKDIRVTPSGVTGEDLLLSPKAEQVFPYVVEVKCQEIVVPASNDSFPSEKPPAPLKQVKFQTSNQLLTKRISNPILVIVGGAFLASATVGG